MSQICKHTKTNIINLIVLVLNGLQSSIVFSTITFGFSVYVSNTTDRFHGILCSKVNYRGGTQPEVFNTTCPVHGQYIIYHNEMLLLLTFTNGGSSTTYSGLCEVEVYGKCSFNIFTQ